MVTIAGRLFDAVLMTFVLVAGVIIIAIAAAVPVDASLRFFFAKSISGLTDLVENGLMAAVLISAPWVLKERGHVAVDLVTHMASEAGRLRLRRIVCLLGGLVSVIFAWAAMSALLAAYDRNMMVRKVLAFPQWWTFVPIVLCFTLCACEFARQFFGGSAISAARSTET